MTPSTSRASTMAPPPEPSVSGGGETLEIGFRSQGMDFDEPAENGRAFRDLLLFHLRQTVMPEAEFWRDVVRLHPGAEPFAFSVSPSAFVVDEVTRTFEARAEALLRVPARRSNGERDMAPLTLAVDVRGEMWPDGTISRHMRLAHPA